MTLLEWDSNDNITLSNLQDQQSAKLSEIEFECRRFWNDLNLIMEQFICRVVFSKKVYKQDPSDGIEAPNLTMWISTMLINSCYILLLVLFMKGLLNPIFYTWHKSTNINFKSYKG